MEETKLTIEGSIALWLTIYSVLIGAPVGAFMPAPVKYIVITLMVVMNYILMSVIL
ncbi:hypothetical protein OURE66S_01218 [Oligella ureolytica]